MKKLMTMMLALVPLGMIAQNSQDVYAGDDDIFNVAYADAGNAFSDEKAISKDASVLDASDDELYEVSDLLLADPDFNVQENMIAYTKDRKTVFFSANKKLKEKKGSPEAVKIKKSVQLQLFKADVKDNGKWVNLSMLPFNGKNHSTGQPALNVDDTKLYFVSDGPESTGKTDIFVVDLLKDGTYGKPENMGSRINSEEREVFPVLDDSSVLYFASDQATEGNELNIFASEIVDDEPKAAIKLDVKANASKEDYIAAFEALGTEEKALAEKAADLRDLEILLESERLAEMAATEEEYKDILTDEAYDFNNKDNVIYTVQIGAFKGNVKTDTYEDSEVLFNHRYDDGLNRFYSGVFESYEDAVAHMESIKEDGYKDAFVLGLKGTQRFLP